MQRIPCRQPHEEGIVLGDKARGNAKSRSNAKNCTNTETHNTDSVVETFGEALPGLILESVVNPNHPDHLCLHTWNGRLTTTVDKVEHRGVAYIPRNLPSGLVQSVRFAPSSLPFGSTAKVISSMRDVLSTYAFLQPEVANLLVAFAMATWFCDSMPLAPVLYLLGPDSAVSLV